MKCINPIKVKDLVSMRTQVVGCNKCNECLKARKNVWTFRLAWELREAKRADFVTLTYNEETVPRISDGKMKYRSLSREDIKRFHNSLRKANDRWYRDQGLEQPDYPMKYYTVGEYGTKTRRPHYHLILFNCRQEVKERIQEIWGKGHVHIGLVQGASMAYVAKYLIDNDKGVNDCIEPPFSIMSKGLGENYLKANAMWHKSPDDEPDDWRMIVINDQNHKQAMPRYYKERIFTREERQYIGEKAAAEALAKEQEEVKDLAKYNTDPLQIGAYRKKTEFKKHRHDNIKTKSKKSNSL